MGLLRAAACVMLLASWSGAVEPAPAALKTVPRRDVPDLILNAVKDWAGARPEAAALESYAMDRENWSPRLLAAMGAAGALYGWFDEGRGSFGVGRWSASMALSGHELRRTVEKGSGGLVRVGLTRPGTGLQLEAALGLRDGRFSGDSVSLAYSLRY